MRLALIAQPYDGVLPPRQNSIGLILYNTAIALAEDHEVALVMKRRGDIIQSNKYPFDPIEVSARLDDVVSALAGRYPRWAKRLRLDSVVDKHLFYLRKVIGRLRLFDPDIIHTVNYWTWSKNIRAARRNKKLVLEMQSEWLSQMAPEKVEENLAVTDAVLTVSDHVGYEFRRAFPTYAGTVATVYNGVDIRRFVPGEKKPRNADPVVLFVGRVSPEKGVHTMLEAFAQVVAEFPKAKLHIVGPRTVLPSKYLVDLSDDPTVASLAQFYNGTFGHDYQSCLDTRVLHLGLEDSVSFLGELSHAAVVPIYQDASVLVNPSLSESFGISIVEGMATGIPVIGTSVGGMRETIVEGETGYLVPPDNPSALAEAIQTLLADTELTCRMGLNGRQRAEEHFSWRARALRLSNIYRLLLP